VSKGPTAALAQARGVPKQTEPRRCSDVLRLVLRTQPRSESKQRETENTFPTARAAGVN